MLYSHLGIHLKVADFQSSKAFYEKLGFTPVFSYGPDQEVKEDYNGIIYQVGETKLEIADGHRAVSPQTFKQPISSSKISLMINVNSLIPIIELCQSNHIPLSVGPRHYYWNTLELVIKDPDGLVLVFIAPYSQSEAKNIQADEKFSLPPTR